MSDRIQPVRTVDETTLVITMRQRTSGFLSRDIEAGEIRQNAESIRRAIRSILSAVSYTHLTLPTNREV